MSDEYVFLLGEKLPWESEVVMAILDQAFSGTPTGTGQTKLRKTVVAACTKAIIALWAKAFGEEYIQLKKVVTDKINDLMKIHYVDVYTGKSKKAKSENQGKSGRQLLRDWRQKHSKLFCILKSGCN